MNIWLLLFLFLLIGVGIFGCIKWLQIFNSPDGERYRRMRTQGPFAPLSEEDVADTEQRRKNRSSTDRVL